MRRRTVLWAALAFAAPAAAAQSALLGGLTQGEASRGVREALSVAAVYATDRLGRRDGFFADSRVHIPLPGVLGRTQQGLRGLGLSAPLDDVELRMNRAAEAAMPQAKSIFLTVVRSITIADALEIVRGGDTAATAFLQDRSTPRLTTLLTPPMRRTLQGSGAFTALDSVAGRYGAGAASTSLRNDVTRFAVEKALSGAFAYIGDKERAIRRDPIGAGSDLLRRVFG
ncbi:MAG: DUF4197 domain-containing protein [Hyphomonadaceae bacterium]